jgi:hypothetical protein
MHPAPQTADALSDRLASVGTAEEWTAARARMWWEENRAGVSLPEAAPARR